MPHQAHQRTFGRTSGHRRAMLRNLTLSVLRYERVKTTEAKAKEVRGFVDRMINLGKDGSLSARRRALAWLPEPEIVEKVFTDLAARYPTRNSGYLRLSHLSRRVGDSAPLMLLELVPGVEEEKETEKRTEAAARPRRRLRLPTRRRAAPAAEEAAATTPAPARRRAAKPAGEEKA
ncbi:MAG: 50S ribosomal protein L17 [Candidatus Limnocylindria bacterium]